MEAARDMGEYELKNELGPAVERERERWSPVSRTDQMVGVLESKNESSKGGRVHRSLPNDTRPKLRPREPADSELVQIVVRPAALQPDKPGTLCRDEEEMARKDEERNRDTLADSSCPR